MNKKSIYLLAPHHTVTRGARTKREIDQRAREIERYHATKPWAKNRKTDGKYGYYYISYDALIGEGIARIVQPIYTIRYHTSDCCLKAKSVNIHGVALALLGNFTDTLPSELQLATLIATWAWYEQEYNLDLKVVLHRDQGKKCNAPTACPGNKFTEWYKNGGREFLVNAVNEFKKTGKLLGGKYVVTYDIPYIYVKPRVQEECTEERKIIEHLKQEVETLRSQLFICSRDKEKILQALEQARKERDEARKEVDELNTTVVQLKEKIREQGKEIDRLNANLKICKAELEECRRLQPWCQKLKDFIVKLLKLILELLRPKIKTSYYGKEREET